MNDDTELRQLLQGAFAPPPESDHDLWPHMEQRLEQRRLSIPWFEWALAVAALVLLAFAPAAIPMLLYWF
ncbi:hypothetical protein [Candidatus Korobacter versatilis]|uniref:hypothetical protein n=1 Tax=Candidatus Korobacter versatilis TaxID=658062 RepID=UPI0002E70F41|nr:hypothetical protein [Candidatus Koribacter versatilis]